MYISISLVLLFEWSNLIILNHIHGPTGEARIPCYDLDWIGF